MATPKISFTATYPGTANEPSYLDLTLNSDSPLGAAGAVLDAWCVNAALAIHVNPANSFVNTNFYPGNETGLVTSNVTSLPVPDQATYLDSVSWLLNAYNGQNHPYLLVQYAIWDLVGQPLNTLSAAQQSDFASNNFTVDQLNALVSEARAQHGVYVPKAGESMAVVLDPHLDGVVQQPLVVEVKAAQLGNYVWHDENVNGIQDAEEKGIADVQVDLVRDIDGDGKFTSPNEHLATTKTDANGLYSFMGLTPGYEYQVQFTTPMGFKVSPSHAAGSTTANDSEGLLSYAVTLAPGENNTTLDSGFYKLGSLGDTVWYDTDRDGVQGADEKGVANATVKLFEAGTDGKFGTADDVLLGTQSTDANGKYLFTDLKKGEYQVEFSQIPEDYAFTKRDSGASDELDSDPDAATGRTATVSLAAGQNRLDVDAGVVEKLGSLGDTVWYDKDRDGVQDDGEVGVKNVTVKLYTAGADGKFGTADDVLLGTQTTDANGKYLFTDLKKGEYQVEFSKLPAKYLFTKQDGGTDDGADSDANVTSGRTDTVSLAAGQHRLDVDAGIVQKLGSLGDTVWYDKDRDGLQDAGETGVKGVTVKLFQAGADGKFGTADDVLLGTQTTDANGKYLFTQLQKGEYQVEFSKLPSDFVFTKQDAGATNYSTDSDANVVTGRTEKITLGTGQDLLTIDAGIVDKLGSLGDTVWYDRDRDGVQDAGERGVFGATVKLFQAGNDGKFGTADDVLLSTRSTDANGKYLFTGLKQGDYQVEFSKLPDGYVFTKQDVGSNDGLDSDANTATGRTGTVSLNAGQSRLDVDAGIVSTYTSNPPPSYPTYTPPSTPVSNYPRPLTSNNNNYYNPKPSTPEYNYPKPSSSNNTFSKPPSSNNNNYSKPSTPEYHYSKPSNSSNNYTKPSNSFNNYSKPSSSDHNYAKPSTSNHTKPTTSSYTKPSTTDHGTTKPTTSHTKPTTTTTTPTKPTTTPTKPTTSHTKPTTTPTKPTTTPTKPTTTPTKPTTSHTKPTETKPSTSTSHTKPSSGSSSSNKSALKSLSSIKSGLQSLLDSTKAASKAAGELKSAYSSMKSHSTSSSKASSSSSYSKPSSSHSSSSSKPSTSHSSSKSSSSFSKPSSSYSSSSHKSSSSYSKPSSSYSSKPSYGDTHTNSSGKSFSYTEKGWSSPGHGEGGPVYHGHDSGSLDKTPIALDLNKDGVIGVTGATSSFQKDPGAELGRTVRFDIDGDGKLDTVEWFDGSGDAILIDNRDGQAATDMNGKRLFGDEGGKFANGYLKLEQFDANGDGKLSGDELKGIQLWVDDGDAVVEEGEIQTLAQHGIAEVSTEMALTVDEEGRVHMQSTATREDGSTMLSEDVWFAAADDAPATAELVDDAVLVDELLGAEAPEMTARQAQELVSDSRGEAVELLRKILAAKAAADATPA